MEIDTGKPSVTIDRAAGQPASSSASVLNYAVVFSQSVTGFSNTDVNLSSTAGANSVEVTGSGTNYNVAVSGMSNSGNVVVSLSADVAADDAGNTNTASTSPTGNSVTYSPSDLVINEVDYDMVGTDDEYPIKSHILPDAADA